MTNEAFGMPDRRTSHDWSTNTDVIGARLLAVAY
jgi:hypothetical protein